MPQGTDQSVSTGMCPPRIVRAKTGCYTCRKRRKKCDERKPVCWNCERNRFICGGYQDCVQWVSHNDMKRRLESRKKAKTRGQPSTAALDNTEATRVDDTRDERDNTRVPSVVSNCDDASPQQEEHGGSDMVGGGYPGLAESAALIRQDGRQPSSPPSFLANPAFFLLPGTVWSCLPALVEGVNSPLERRLFIHFVSIMSPTLVLNSSGITNPLTHAVVQLALYSPGVMRTLLAVSACHLSRVLRMSGFRRDDNYLLHLERGKLELYGDAIRFHSRLVAPLATRPAKRNEHLRTIFATSMLLCQFDTCDGGTHGTWRMHLAAADELLRQYRVQKASFSNEQSSHRPLVDWYNYHDGIARLFYSHTEDMTDAGGNGNSNGDDNENVDSDGMDPENPYILIGTRDGLLSIIRQIANLRSRSGIVCPFPGRVDPKRVQPWHGRGIVSVDMLALGIEISADLQAWKFDYRTEQHQVVAECYRWSVFIMLYSIIHPNCCIGHEKIQQALGKGLEWLESLCATDNAQTCCLLPIFVFGIAATTESNRATVTEKAEAYRLWSGLGNAEETNFFLQQWWKKRDAQGNVVNWWDWRLLAVELDVAITVV